MIRDVPSRFEQVHPMIFRLSVPFPGGGAVQVYLIRGARLALIDTGIASSPTRYIAPAMDQLGLELTQVDVVINTHGHFDHIGGNAEVKSGSNAEILIHASDVAYAQSPHQHVAMARQPFETLGLAELAEERAGFVLGLVGESAGADRILEDGDVIDLGDGTELQVLHTPGHSAGSICLYWEDERILLCGDAVQGRGSRCGGLPIYDSAAEYRRSLERLAGLSVRLLLLGHWFHWQGPIPSPVREQHEIAGTFEDSFRVCSAIDQAVREALDGNRRRRPLEIAQVATRSLSYALPILLEKASGLPFHGARTLVAHIVECLGNSAR